MGIEASLEVSKGEGQTSLALVNGVIASKAIANLCTGVLGVYCGFRDNLLSKELDSSREEIDLISAIAARMTTNLCVLVGRLPRRAG